MSNYSTASLRGVLPVDLTTGKQCISFDLADGRVLRLALDSQSAKKLSEWLAGYQDVQE